MSDILTNVPSTAHITPSHPRTRPFLLPQPAAATRQTSLEPSCCLPSRTRAEPHPCMRQACIPSDSR
eukprot:6181017-Pleurochrysis_carterae.AAC.1